MHFAADNNNNSRLFKLFQKKLMSLRLLPAGDLEQLAMRKCWFWEVWMFQRTVSISSDFYLTFWLGKVEALCFSLITLTFKWITFYNNKCCNEDICKNPDLFGKKESSLYEKFQNGKVLLQKLPSSFWNFFVLERIGTTAFRELSLKPTSSKVTLTVNLPIHGGKKKKREAEAHVRNRNQLSSGQLHL